MVYYSWEMKESTNYDIAIYRAGDIKYKSQRDVVMARDWGYTSISITTTGKDSYTALQTNGTITTRRPHR